eukprot:XP_011665729.1 PREDICTED: uncharacterized protein LOC105438982 [Strongylocentrotus purpuratus]
MLGDIQRYARDQSPSYAEVITNRVTNSVVENWFGNIKKDFCGGNCIRLRSDQFIRKAYTNVVGRLGELELRPMKKGSGSKGKKNKKQAPWYAQFGDVDDNGRLDNIYYTPGLMAMPVNQFMHIFPLWSAVMLGDIQRYARDQPPCCTEVIPNRVTNSTVEHWFGIVKQDFCGGNRIQLRPAQFIRRAYTNVVGRLGVLELRPMKKGSRSKRTKNKK